MKNKARTLPSGDRLPRTSQIWVIFLTALTGAFIVALAILAFLAASSSSMRVETSASPQSGVVSDPEVPTSREAARGSIDSLPATYSAPAVRSIPEPADSSPRLVLDQSYWRLARQGKARILPGTEQFFTTSTDTTSVSASETSSTAQDPHNLANFSELNLADLSELQSYHLTWFNVYGQLSPRPGEIICRLRDADGEIVISVPHLSSELQTLADQRGDHYFMIFASRNDVTSFAQLIFYQENAQITLVKPDDSPVLALADADVGQVSYSLFSDRNALFVSAYPEDRDFTTEVVDQIAFARAGRLFATSTQFEAAPEQTALIQSSLVILESLPLPQELTATAFSPR